MDCKKPSDFPRKSPDLFHEDRHRHIGRRSFLDGARKSAVLAAGLGGASSSASLMPRSAR